MSETFDAYHVWLGIPPEEQPPHHYRLLGIKTFESNPEVIEHAADQRMAHLKSFQAGKHAVLTQKLLNRVAAAKVCLLNPESRRQYDEKLRQRFAEEETRVNMPSPIKRSKSGKTSAIVGGAVAGVVVLVLLFLLWPSKPTPVQVAAVVPISKAAVVTQRPEPKPVVDVPKPTPKPLVETPVVPPQPIVVVMPEPKPVMDTPKPAPKPEPKSIVDTPKPTPQSKPNRVVDTPKPAPKPEPKPKPEPEPKPKKQPVPDDETVKQARKVVSDIFGDQVTKRTGDRKALAERLLLTATEKGKTPAEQYALMEMAADVATKSGDGNLAFMMVDRTAEMFDIDVFSWKEDVLSTLAKSTKNPAGHAGIAAKTLELMDEAIGQDNFESATRLGKFAQSEATKGRDKEVMQRARARLKDADAAAKAFIDIKAASERLKTNPNLPADNTVVGSYTCFVKQDWSTGIPLLAKCDDESLRALAVMEMKPTLSPTEQLGLAEAWYEKADGEKGATKKNIQVRAAHWYWLAAPDLEGLDKAKAEKKMKTLASLVANLPAPKQLVNKKDGSTLALIPAGKFLAGDKRIVIDLPSYYLGVYTVTNAQYLKFVDSTGRNWGHREFPPEKAKHPAKGISWEDARDYCRWAGLRLPTELECEKGARGTDGREYPWGNTWNPRLCHNNATDTCPVDSFPDGCSPYGLFQMTTNVSVWCAEWFDKNAFLRYQRGDLSLPTASSDNPPTRAMRGGYYGHDEPKWFNCTNRGKWNPNAREVLLSIRVAKDVSP